MGIVNKCSKCNKKGVFLKLINGLCRDCYKANFKKINKISEKELYEIGKQEKKILSEKKERIFKENKNQESQNKLKLKQEEEFLLNKKDDLYSDIQNNHYDLENKINEYKETLNKLLNFSSANDNNINILINEIEEKEEGFILVNNLQTCINILNDQKYLTSSMLLSYVDDINNIYLPKIKGFEEKNIRVTDISSNEIEQFVAEKLIQIERKVKKEQKEAFDKKNYVVFDLETTGLSPITNEIIEIGALKIKDGKIVDTFEVLIKPSKKITKKITDINGITNEMVADAESINDVLPKFIDFIEKLTLVAHNAKFDYGFVNENYKRIYGKEFRRKKTCTMEMYRKWYKDQWGEKPYSAKLGDIVIELLEIDAYSEYKKNSHRGLNDAMFTNKIYQHMINN